ncbi:PREDICTED: F-box/kelch-repeat protein At3g27150-like [Lupinus angustifolius]|uniref:F-box/kelch-repeat protein At3g27150-like n=1 Tax=Lupinus angustifolius TaxID=3871 RepID=UPI00092E5406|nr:PREDICTED: F-box/kelch-repeat protein At3g27150-like [Lupinus angustifolius]
MSRKKTWSVWTFGGGICMNSHNFSPENMRILELLTSKATGSSSGQEPQDADYDVPCLSDELETMILARFPISEHWKLCVLNKQFLAALKKGEVYKIRREIGFKEPSVFMLASGESNWCAFDENFKCCKKLPIIPSDYSFEYGDKESFSAGTNLFVSGKEIDGAVIWRYELPTNEWFKGPSMNTSRCLFASASCGIYAFVAGGLETKTCREVLSSAERYNSESHSWETLPKMIRKRKFCSGCYMDNKFYVIGGQDEQHNDLTCGEFFDQKTNSWNLIPNMLKDILLSSSRSPPLVAVANNELYTLDASSNEVKVYLKESNSWKKLGTVPVRADAQGGWGVAFKSLGNKLLVIGATSLSYSERALTIYTCFPDPAFEKLPWKQIVCSSTKLNPFIHNCAVMLA